MELKGYPVFGDGVVANVLLARTKGNNAGWIVITAAWGLAVFIGAFCSAPFSGAHLNSAVTVAMAMTGKLEIAKVAGYIVAPLVTYGFTFAAGTGHIVYPLLPAIYEVAHENGIRPERPMAVATIASQQAITASPESPRSSASSVSRGSATPSSTPTAM